MCDIYLLQLSYRKATLKKQSDFDHRNTDEGDKQIKCGFDLNVHCISAKDKKKVKDQTRV